MVHANDMLVCWLVTMILLNDFVKEWSKSVVAVVAASVNNNSRVGPLCTREDDLFEGISVLVFLIL